MKDLSLLDRVIRRIRYECWRALDNPAILTTRQGVFRLPIGVPDPISRDLFLHGEFELDLMTEAMQLLRRLSERPKGKGTLLDIGANNGVISIGMLVNGELDRAIAIEPEPVNFARLQDNVSLNQLDDAVLRLNCALSDKKSTLTFELSDQNYGDHRVRTSSAPSAEGSSASRIDPSSPCRPTHSTTWWRSSPARFTEDIAVVWIEVVRRVRVCGCLGIPRPRCTGGVPEICALWHHACRHDAGCVRHAGHGHLAVFLDQAPRTIRSLSDPCLPRFLGRGGTRRVLRQCHLHP